MMTPEEVKPLLVHEDRYIRQAAGYYFEGTWSRDTSIVPLILESYRTYGVDDSLLNLAWCDRFALDNDSIQEMLSLLSQSTDERVIRHVNRIVANAAIDLQDANYSTILATPNLSAETVAAIEQRREFAGWPASNLWNELLTFADECKNEYASEADVSYYDALIAALVRHSVPNADEICERLATIEEQDGWLEIFLVELAGERRLKQAVPVLVDKYSIDTDFLLDSVTQALGKIGDPEAIQLIRSAYADESWNYRNYACAVLGDIKHPSSENTLLELLEIEKDESQRTMICWELCKLFSAQGVPAILEEIDRGYDEMMVCLEDLVLPIAEVLAIELPHAEEWKAERDERDESYASLKTDPLLLPDYSDTDDPAYDDPLDDLEIQTEEFVETSTIRNETMRVGRNDPCPCGSGKKFKKCCARRP